VDSIVVERLVWAISIALFIATLPGTVELALFFVGALRRRAPHTSACPPARELRLAVIVPVHNEEIGLPATLRSLASCDDPVPTSDLIVMACNCSDRTVELARAFGCTVLERIDPTRRGKGYGLNYAFRHLARENYEAYLIVDADTSVERNFLNAFRGMFARGGDAGQCILKVGNPDANTRTRLMHIAFLAFTFLRPLARHRLGLSAGIFGNGFGVSAKTVDRIPYECFSIAEDLEYHTKLVRAGKLVEFLPDTSVSTAMCLTKTDAKPQRERWEGGRFRIMAEQGPQLAYDVFVRGHVRLLEPLLELLLLPLAYHVILLLLLLVTATGPLFVYACGALLLVAAHVTQAMVLGGASAGDWKALATSPVYIVGKLMNLSGVLKASRKSTPWKRTHRSAAD
jgi:cellulose synthase/poly-beta-1,6-N-acetylglucosamine synthase-like glycosyltransferase